MRHGRHYSLLGALAWILCLLATVHCSDPQSTTPAAAEAASTSVAPVAPSTPAPEPTSTATAESAVAPSEDASAERPAIVFLGTSLTAGYGLPEDEAYPALIQARLDAAGLDYRVVNAGVSGDTSAGGLRRLDWLLRLPIAVLVVELGANDMLRGQSTEALEQNLAAILERTRAAHPGVRFVVEGMRAAPNLGRDYATAFDAVYPRLAERFAAALVPFVLEDVVARPQLNQADGIHPTAEGHGLIAERVWRTLEPVVRAAAAPEAMPEATR
ncbi:MAG: arylesterase [Deltaproteobacteria bacterium]|nr:arylesterase [Deltaproteobacteria bacterium]